jgi:hypothetical protein
MIFIGFCRGFCPRPCAHTVIAFILKEYILANLVKSVVFVVILSVFDIDCLQSGLSASDVIIQFVAISY